MLCTGFLFGVEVIFSICLLFRNPQDEIISHTSIRLLLKECKAFKFNSRTPAAAPLETFVSFSFVCCEVDSEAENVGLLIPRSYSRNHQHGRGGGGGVEGDINRENITSVRDSKLLRKRPLSL